MSSLRRAGGGGIGAARCPERRFHRRVRASLGPVAVRGAPLSAPPRGLDRRPGRGRALGSRPRTAWRDGCVRPPVRLLDAVCDGGAPVPHGWRPGAASKPAFRVLPTAPALPPPEVTRGGCA